MGVENNLGFEAAATYGLDIVALGSSNYTGRPHLRSQVVAALESYEYYTGIFGLGRWPINLTTLPIQITLQIQSHI